MKGNNVLLRFVVATATLSACAAPPSISASRLTFLNKESTLSNQYEKLYIGGQLVAEITSNVGLLEFGRDHNYHVSSSVITCKSKKRLSGLMQPIPLSELGKDQFRYAVVVDYKTNRNDPIFGTGAIPDYNLAKWPENLCLQVTFGGIGKFGRKSNEVVISLTPEITSSMQKFDQKE